MSAVQIVKPLIICPLEYELWQMRNGLEEKFGFACTGPGPAGVLKWFREHEPARGRIIILAGLAGAITSGHRAGAAAIIDEVVDDRAGARWKPTLALAGVTSSNPACIITSAAVIIENRAQRERLHQQTGAHLVDLESIAFAKAATAAGLNWGIVRGISDDLDSGIAGQVSGLVDQYGRTRPWRAIGEILRSPRLVPSLLRLGKVSRRALGEVRIILGNASFRGAETAG
jgi:hypothetical protein